MFDQVLSTMMDIKDKTKDDVDERMYLTKYCRRRELELQKLCNGKDVKPKANFALSKEQKVLCLNGLLSWECSMTMSQICIDV